MRNNPQESEIAVFRTFTARAMEIQKQLETAYHWDMYLRERLKEAIYIASVQDTLRDRPEISSQQKIETVYNRLSDRRKTAELYSDLRQRFR